MTDCAICYRHHPDESGCTILAALQRNAEHVLRHLRQYAHTHADLFVPLASDSAREREHRRKATA